MSFRASVTTYDGEPSRNSAYFVSLILASSSSRNWTTVVFGCLGGAFKTGIELVSSLDLRFVLLRIPNCLLLCMHAAKPRPPLLGDEAGATPRALRRTVRHWTGSLPPQASSGPRAISSFGIVDLNDFPYVALDPG